MNSKWIKILIFFLIFFTFLLMSGCGHNDTSPVPLEQSNSPASPDNLSTAVISQNQINLTWRDNSDNETNFNIERGDGNNFSIIATVPSGTVSYTDAGLAADTNYCYRTAALSGSIEDSSYSDVVCATTFSPYQPVISDGAGREWPDEFGDALICRWKNDKIAAYSLTIDDNNAPDIDWWKEQAGNYGFKFTWFIVTDRVGTGPYWGEWQGFSDLLNDGHDIQSHTRNHLNNPDTISIEEEYSGSLTEIENNITGHNVGILAYPWGYPGSNPSGMVNDIDVASNYYIAARGTQGHNNIIGSTEYMHVSSMDGINTSSPDIHWTYLPNLIEYNENRPGHYNAWQCGLFHSVDESLKATIIEGFDYIRQNEDDIWFGLFREVAMYGQERDTASLTINSSTSDEIHLSVTDQMDNNVFNYPLTIKFKLDSSWINFSAVQNGTFLSVTMIHYDGDVYALIDAIPDNGEIVLSKTDTTTENVWKILPIRSEEEAAQGLVGGESTQHFHSITRSFYNPNYIYATQDMGGPWRSTDAGETWSKTMDSGLNVVDATQSIAVDPVNPEVVFLISSANWNYLTSGYDGLYRSQDGGNSWTLVLETETNFDWNEHRTDSHNIACDKLTASIGNNQAASTWYVAFPKNGLFRSDSSGNDWELVSPLDEATHGSSIFSVKVDPVNSNKVYVATGNGLFFSDERGENLRALGDIPDGLVTAIEINPDNPQIMFASLRVTRVNSGGYSYTIGEGLYKTVNGGLNFTRILEHDISKVYMNPRHPEWIYITGSWQQLQISDDGGDSWKEVSSVTSFPGFNRDAGWRVRISGQLSGIAPNPDNPQEAVAYANAAFWKTNNGGNSFHESSTLFTGYAWAHWNSAVAFDKFNPGRFAFFNHDIHMRITGNNGEWFGEPTTTDLWGWSQLHVDSPDKTDGIGAQAGSFQPIEGSEVIVATVGQYRRNRLVRSDNNGVTWNLIDTAPRDPSDNYRFISFHPDDPDYVYAGNKISTDAGVTFQKVEFLDSEGEKLKRASGDDLVSPMMLGICFSNPDVVYGVDGYWQRIIRSDDRGNTWSIYKDYEGWKFGVSGMKVVFAVDPFDADRIYTVDSRGDFAYFDGSNFSSTGLLDFANGGHLGNYVSVITTDPTREGVVYASMHSTGISNVWRSLDGGDSWTDISANLPRIRVGAMGVNPHTGELYVGTHAGTWIYPAPPAQLLTK